MKKDLVFGFIMILLIIVLLLNVLLIFKVVNVSRTVDDFEHQLDYQDICTESSEQVENDDKVSVEIWIDEEYNIHRTGVDSDIDTLGWEIVYNGERVLSRNARNETVYKYFRSDPGTYTVYMTCYIDGSYRVVSNIESYYIE